MTTGDDRPWTADGESRPTAGGTCTYELPIPDYEATFPWLDDRPSWGLQSDADGDGTLGVHGGIWHCPHDAVDGDDRCPFHGGSSNSGAKASDSSPAERLVERVAAANALEDPHERARNLQFIGAEIDRLDLSSQVLGGGSRETIDLRHARLGTVSCRRTAFDQPIDFSGVTFDPGAAPADADGREVLDPALGQIPFGIDFTHAECNDIVRFDGAEFRRPALFRDAEFRHPTSFGDARFHDHVSFLTADFHDIVMFDDARFHRDLRLQACECVDLVDLKRSWVGGRLSLDRMTCRGDVEFDDATLASPPPDDDLDRPSTTFHGRLTADMAAITGRLSGNRVTIADEMRIRHADLGQLRLRDPAVGSGTDGGEIEHTGTDGGGIERTDIDDGRTGYVDLTGSTVEAGTLGQPCARSTSDRRGSADDGGPDSPPSDELIYDLYRTTLGDVRFEGEGDRPLIERIRFHRTHYDGFDFTDGDAIDLGSVDHWIHRFDVDPLSLPCYCADGPEHGGRYIVDDATCPRHDRGFDHDSLQATYAYAKNGADDAGDNASAGAFFYREMCSHRKQHLDEALSADHGAIRRLVASTRWGRSWLLAATTGYGEQPYRVVVSSLLVVFGFSYVYWNVEPLGAEYGVLEALVFSFQSFVSFVLGPPEGASLLAEALSAVQGFLGAFLIALFVFTFTRRIHR